MQEDLKLQTVRKRAKIMRDLKHGTPLNWNEINNWGEISKALKNFPEQREFCWALVLQKPEKFLNDWFDISCALKNFPEQREFCWAFVLQKPEKFLNSWLDIKSALQNFPEQREFCWAFVLQKPEKFLNSWLNIESALQNFPERKAECRDFVFKNPAKFFKDFLSANFAIKNFPEHSYLFKNLTIDEIRERIEEYRKGESRTEIKKNAHELAFLHSQTKHVNFFQTLPGELLVNIAALTGDKSVVTKMEANDVARKHLHGH